MKKWNKNINAIINTHNLMVNIMNTDINLYIHININVNIDKNININMNTYKYY